jgi:hypothetical protein
LRLQLSLVVIQAPPLKEMIQAHARPEESTQIGAEQSST